MRWGLRHGAYLIALLSALAMVDRGSSSLDVIVFAALLIGVVHNTCYCLGYFLIAGFWLASVKFSWLTNNHEEHHPAVEDMQAWHQEAIHEFRSTTVNSSNKQMTLDGSSAQIMRIDESGGSQRPERSQFIVTIYCCNHAGEYFLFKKIGANKPYVKHIKKSVAEKALGLTH